MRKLRIEGRVQITESSTLLNLEFLLNLFLKRGMFLIMTTMIRENINFRSKIMNFRSKSNNHVLIVMK